MNAVCISRTILHIYSPLAADFLLHIYALLGTDDFIPGVNMRIRNILFPAIVENMPVWNILLIPLDVFFLLVMIITDRVAML